jgi:serine/threonine-protein kinase
MPPELQPGATIGSYRLESEIARGGMGAIWRARHLEMDAVVAIKVLKDDLASQPETLKRFTREGKLIARLDHANIIKIYEFGRQGELHYIIMQFIDGKNLQEILDEGGPLPIEKALRIVRSAAAALAHAHDLNIIHRDIKPSNLLIAKDGTVYLTDFGIARFQVEDTHLTRAGVLLGTPTYMSPEQCRGECVDPRSDLYSLGCMLYALIGGKPPFAGRTPARLITQILNDQPPPIESVAKDVPPGAASLIKRLMAKHPAARPQTARELVDAIDLLLNERPITVEARPPEPSREAMESTGARSGVLAFALIALVAAGAFLVAWPDVDDGSADAAGPGEDAATSGVEPPPRGASRKTPPSKDVRVKRRRPAREQLEKDLEQRLVIFERLLLENKMEEAAELVEPSLRNHPSLMISLGRLGESVKSLGKGCKVQRASALDDDRAAVSFSFKSPESGKTLQFSLSWRWREEGWFFMPQQEPGRSQ